MEELVLLIPVIRLPILLRQRQPIHLVEQLILGEELGLEMRYPMLILELERLFLQYLQQEIVIYIGFRLIFIMRLAPALQQIA